MKKFRRKKCHILNVDVNWKNNGCRTMKFSIRSEFEKYVNWKNNGCRTMKFSIRSEFEKYVNWKNNGCRNCRRL